MAELPLFSNDWDADAWLRSNSPAYDSMAKEVDRRGGYNFRSWNEPRGTLVHENGGRYVQLNPALKGGERLSILTFEITNIFQDEKHREIDQRARTGAIRDAEMFALRHELIEYDGLRFHRKVLEDLEKSLGAIPREMLTWINPQLATLWQLPSAPGP